MHLLLFEKVFMMKIKISQKMTIVEEIIQTCFNKGDVFSWFFSKSFKWSL